MSEETEKKESKWERRELGALWRKQGANQKYLSGFIKIGDELEEVRVDMIVFANKHKHKNSKAPDFVIYESEAPKRQSTNNEESEPINQEDDGTSELMED